MSDSDAWFSSVRSWTLALSEEASTPPDENGSFMTSSHAGSGQLDGDGQVFEARIAFTESSRVVDHFTIPTVTTMNGVETWLISLVVTGSTYRIAVDQTSASSTVPQKTVAENTGQTYKTTSFVPWGIFNIVEGSFPKSAGVVSGSVAGSLDEDGCNGNLTFSLSPVGGSGGGGGGGARQSEPNPPSSKTPKTPKKPRRHFPEVPDLLTLLIREEGASAAEAAKYVADCDKMGCVRCVIAWVNQWGRIRAQEVPDEAWAELDQINARPKIDRFCCADHQGHLRAGVALWVGRKMPAGHTAWTIEIPPDYVTYYKNHGGSSWLDGQWVTGTFHSAIASPFAWGQQEIVCPSSPQEQFREQEYASYKAFRSKGGHYEAALVAASQYTGAFYSIIGQNCADETWAVLRTFGVYLGPSPNVGIAPYVWYYELEGTETILRKISSVEQAQLAALRDGQALDSTSPERTRGQVGISAAYQIRPGLAVHLSPDCPALLRAGSAAQTFPLERFRSPEKVEEEFGSPVCELCVQQLRAESKIRFSTSCLDDRLVHIYPDCVAIHTPAGWLSGPGLTEIPLTDFVERRRGFKLPFSAGFPVRITYRLDLPDGNAVNTETELKFESEEDRSTFEEALDQAVADDQSI